MLSAVVCVGEMIAFRFERVVMRQGLGCGVGDGDGEGDGSGELRGEPGTKGEAPGESIRWVCVQSMAPVGHSYWIMFSSLPVKNDKNDLTSCPM